MLQNGVFDQNGQKSWEIWFQWEKHMGSKYPSLVSMGKRSFDKIHMGNPHPNGKSTWGKSWRFSAALSSWEVKKLGNFPASHV